MLASRLVRTLGVLGVVAAMAWPSLAHGAEAEAPPEEEDPDVVLSNDSWFIRLDVGLAYLRANTRYFPVADESEKGKFEPEGTAITLQMAIAARLGRDVTLGGLGRIAPRVSRTAHALGYGPNRRPGTNSEWLGQVRNCS